MSGNGVESPKQPTSPYRPRHQITRSISEISSPVRLGRHHNYGNQSSQQRKDRDNDDKAAFPQSAASVLLAPVSATARTSLDVPRSEAITPNFTPSQSRRESILISSLDDPTLPSKPLSDEELRLEKEKAMGRAAGLKKSLADLSTLSAATTRRLDDTYYGVLEKLSALQSTILALKDLAASARDTTETFRIEARGLVADASSQLDAFGDFDAQEDRIEALQGRIRVGRERAQALSARVDAVRDRVEGWERADREWQERTRRRLKVGWVVTSVVILLLLLLFIGAQYAPEGVVGAGLEGATARLANETMGRIRNGNETEADNVTDNGSSWDAGGETGTQRLRETFERMRPAGEPDGVLRVFDEL
ncbi:hypothetical protein NKR23_g482 [Pleurostoma richardsiae]|uniref:Uncharacterized protein n=1 Tax=Pleurostoma richardsiae TaxID=41990 RepID=A0AA38VQZ6_9PEZI|nr:hypothetical protein NKR23_g482 [Pleurostoma richardsiae]